MIFSSRLQMRKGTKIKAIPDIKTEQYDIAKYIAYVYTVKCFSICTITSLSLIYLYVYFFSYKVGGIRSVYCSFCIFDVVIELYSLYKTSQPIVATFDKSLGPLS